MHRYHVTAADGCLIGVFGTLSDALDYANALRTVYQGTRSFFVTFYQGTTSWELT